MPFHFVSHISYLGLSSQLGENKAIPLVFEPNTLGTESLEARHTKTLGRLTCLTKSCGMREQIEFF